MSYYRIYQLNAAGRVAGSAVDAICADDQEACQIARRLLTGEGCVEVWSGTRYVGEVSISRPRMGEPSGQQGRPSPPWVVGRSDPPSWGRPDLFAAAELSACEEAGTPAMLPALAGFRGIDAAGSFSSHRQAR